MGCWQKGRAGNGSPCSTCSWQGAEDNGSGDKAQRLAISILHYSPPWTLKLSCKAVWFLFESLSNSCNKQPWTVETKFVQEPPHPAATPHHQVPHVAAMMANTTLSKLLVCMVLDEVTALDFKKPHLPEVEIGGATFCIVAVRKDISVQRFDSLALTHDYASRLHIDCFPKTNTNPNPDLQILRTAAHVFVTGHRADDSARDITVDDAPYRVIIDTDSLHEATALQNFLPLCAAPIISHAGNMSADALKRRYEAYIDAINERTMTQALPAHCQNIVTHNGKPLPLSEYQQLMEGAQAAIPDIEFSIAGTLVDSDKQMLAAKLDFRGKPTGEFAGVTPSGGGGKEVWFSEIVFYWFQHGKIVQVVSLVDLESYRKQVTGED